MIDTENLIVKLDKDLEHFKTRYEITDRDAAEILLSLGLDCYLKDLTTRNLNGNTIPYLAQWHLRKGIRYYQQDLIGK